MKKLLSLVKASMTEGMQLFKIKKGKKTSSKLTIPIILGLIFMIYIGSYAYGLMEELIPIHQEKALLTIFLLLNFLVITIEGIYKSGGLLFNCTDDSLLLSLPIKKSTVLFLRVFKFYIFELLFTIIILAPTFLIYGIRMHLGITFYLLSLLVTIFAPIFPVIISCIIGSIISGLSTRFKHTNIVQIIISMSALLFCMYLSFTATSNSDSFVDKLIVINNASIKYYYTASAYSELINNFSIINFLLFLIIHIGLIVLFLLSMSKLYYKINSRLKEKSTTKHKSISKNKIKTNTIMNSLVKKELKTFINVPVLVVNAAFGLVMFIVAVIIMSLKCDSIVDTLISQEKIPDKDIINTIFPAILYGLIVFSSLMSSITSSVISLEGKKINILKSIPVKPSTIIFSKVLAAIIIMIPLILVGDIIMFIRFKFSILDIILCLIATIILPLVAELLGIIVNLKYPKMNATNDTEVVKQSMSSTIAVLVGLLLCMITMGIIFALVAVSVMLKLGRIGVDLAILLSLIPYIIICGLLLLYIKKKAVIKFNNINI